MRLIIVPLLVVWVASAGTAGAEVTLTIRNCRVTLKASNATIAEILEEWARIGQTRIVNGESVTAELVNVDLTDVPETHALDAILSSVAG